MPFQYPQPAPNPYAASISDLMLRQGDLAGAQGLIQAQGQVQQANISAHNANTLGNIAQALPGQIQQAQAAQQNAAMKGLAIKQASETDAAHTAFVEALKNAPRISIAAGGPFDVPGIAKSMADGGYDPSVAAKALEGLNDSFQKAELAKLALVQHGAASISLAGNDTELASHFIDTLEETKMYTPEQLAHYRSMSKTTAGVAQLTSFLMGPPPIENAPAGSMSRNKLTGSLVPGSQVPEKANEWDVALKAAGGDPLEAVKMIHPDRLPTEVSVAMDSVGKAVHEDGTPLTQAEKSALALTKLRPLAFPAAGGTEDVVTRALQIATANNGGQPLTPQQIQDVTLKAKGALESVKPEQEFVIRKSAVTPDNPQGVIPIRKGTAQTGDMPYTPSQNESVVQSKLEQQYRQVMEKILSNRSGGLGLEDQKVNQALHLLSIFDQNRDPKTGEYTIPKVLQTELAIGLARLISPTGVTDKSTIENINQRTAASDIAGALTYITGTPVTGNTQDIFKMLKDSIQRQGNVAHALRGTYLNSMRAMAPSDLDPERAAKLEQALNLNHMPESNFEPGSGKTPAVGDTMKKFGATYKWDGLGWQKQ